MILHLVEWAIFDFIKAHAFDKLEIFVSEVLEDSNAYYASFSILMAAAGSLRASSGSIMPALRRDTIYGDNEYPRQAQMDVSVEILVSFSCIEYFRHIHLPQYMETICSIVTSVQENESACVAFVESLPSYAELTNPQAYVFLHTMKYMWYEDEVQTARILFYLRVLPTSVECLPSPIFGIFGKRVASTMFLYFGHPDPKVSSASHSVFASFISSGKDPVEDERVSSKEQLVFYYIKRSLEGYPGNIPLDGLATGVAALVRHLPAGCAPLYYDIHSLVEKSRDLCRVMNEDTKGGFEPCMKILELLLHLTSMVDIQVLPELMKLLAQLIVELPKMPRMWFLMSYMIWLLILMM